VTNLRESPSSDKSKLLDTIEGDDRDFHDQEDVFLPSSGNYDSNVNVCMTDNDVDNYS
jgi:hypothetical protein